ncbi:MAG: hypothetical protein JO051_13280 [Acidobacteriaceae bacterium]|nr:hypothetical protein [Acidobacteriaceae bacterium]
MLDNWLDSAVILLPILLSVAGVVVSINAPKSHHRKWWYAGLVVCGILLSALTFWQQAKARSSHDAEVAALNKRIEQLDFDVRSNPPKVQVTVPVPNVTITNPTQSTALRDAKTRDDQNGLRSLTNAQLKKQTLALAERMKDFERIMMRCVSSGTSSIVFLDGAPTKDTKESLDVYAAQATVYNNTLLPQAIAFRAELWRRVGAINPDSDMRAFAALPTKVDSVGFDSHPIQDAAKYLEKLATELPR